MVFLPKVLVEELERRDKILDVGVSELLFSLVVGGSDPEGSAKYLSGTFELLEQAKREVEGGDLRQASEKIWGACALAVKAYAYARDGRRITSHGELWRYSEVLAGDLGDWVAASWAHANSMHTNFYEGWATRWHVEKALRAVEKLVKAIVEKVG